MVRPLIVTVLVACLGAPAAAEDSIDLVPKLGFRIGHGAMPLVMREARTTTLGLGVEHPTFGKVRMFAEYEWMWLSEWDEGKAKAAMVPLLHGSGQRVQLGLRRTLAHASLSSHVRFYLDGELGGGAMLGSEDWTGTTAVMHGLAGFRLGYDFRNGDSSSRILELEVMVRAIVVPTGYGLLFGVGMLWGD